MSHKRVTIWIVIVSALLGIFISTGYAADEPFPQYEVIEPNVSFWIKIYADYSTRQAVVHDSLRMDRDLRGD
jgi:membrane-bound lytic murein transglycosylase D